MNRLAVRLALAMIAVAALSQLVMVSVQVYSVRRQFALTWPETPPPFRSGRDTSELEVRAWRELGENIRQRQLQSLIATGIVSAGLWVLLAFFLARSIAKPIEQVSGAAERVAHGDFSTRVAVDRGRSGKDETQQLMHNFNAMAEALERYESERKAMIADIAHELRTPLTAMQGRLEALIDGLTPFDTQEAERLHRQTKLLARLVNDLRTLSLADAGRLSLNKQPTDMVKLVRQTAASFEDRADKKQVSLELKLPADTPFSLHADADRLAQVLSNLLDNALRHTPEQGRVEVQLRQEADQMQLSVSDTGPGFGELELSRLFDRFYKASGDALTGKGSGLGLAIVKALVELHGGTVSADNRPGAGARITVKLPQRVEGSPPATDAPEF